SSRIGHTQRAAVMRDRGQRAGVLAEDVTVGQLPGKGADRLRHDAAASVEKGVRVGDAQGPGNGVAGVVREIGIVRRTGNGIGKPIRGDKKIAAEYIREKEIRRDIGQGQNYIVTSASRVIDPKTKSAGRKTCT